MWSMERRHLNYRSGFASAIHMSPCGCFSLLGNAPMAIQIAFAVSFCTIGACAHTVAAV